MSKLGTIFKYIAKPFVWIGDELDNLPKALNKLITLSSDAKDIASDAATEVIEVSTDVGTLVVAAGKDDGASLQAIETLLKDVGPAIAAKGTDWQSDVAIIQAIEAFFASVNGTNYVDVLAAIAKIIADGKSMTTTVIQDFKKLETDATS